MSIAKTPVETTATSPSSPLDLGSPEGFEVFVGRMPLKTSEQQLLELAAPFSPTAGRVRPKRRYPYLCGFVVFDHLEQAEGFIAANHGKAAFGGPNPLNVRFSDGKNASKKIFVGGLAVSTDVEMLKQIVSIYGTVLAANILGRKNRAPCGFVTFATSKQAQACIAGMHDAPNSDKTKKYVVKIGDGGSAESTKKRNAGKPNNDENDTSSVKRRRKEYDNSESSTATSTPRQDVCYPNFLQPGLTSFNLNQHDHMHQQLMQGMQMPQQQQQQQVHSPIMQHSNSWGQQQVTPMNLLANGGQVLQTMNSGLFVNQQPMQQQTPTFVDQNGNQLPVIEQQSQQQHYQMPQMFTQVNNGEDQQQHYMQHMPQMQPVQQVFVDPNMQMQPLDANSQPMQMMQPVMLQPVHMMPMDNQHFHHQG